MHKIIKRFGVILLAMTLMLALPLSAQAATADPVAPATEEKKLTYDERVAVLKTNYSVTFKGKAKYPETWTSKDKDVSLQCLENATKLVGSHAMHIIAKPHINAVGSFNFYAGFDTNNIYGNALYEDKRIYFDIPITDWELKSGGVWNRNGTKSYDKSSPDEMVEWVTEIYTQAIIHEIGHAYDLTFLQGEGSRIVGNINGKYDSVAEENAERSSIRSWRSKYFYGDNSYLNAKEDFAVIFDYMISCDKKITEIGIGDFKNGQWYDRNLTKNDIIYKKCEAVYALMLRDFGADSAAVKRAAKFLDKELPA